MTLLPVLVLAACAQANQTPVSSETMPECMARMHIENPMSAPVGLHTACNEFVGVANGGRAEIIRESASTDAQGGSYPPNNDNAVAAALLVDMAASRPAYQPPPMYLPPPVITTTCNRFGANTTCTTQ
nr:hypothetical protein [uncultured Lichenicoccus sp.]